MALNNLWARLKERGRPIVHRRRRTKLRAGRRAIAARQPAVDPVALTVLALNRLGPATFRTVALGTSVTVTVPDAATGAIFRAALGETQKARATDRLIRIEIASEPASCRPEA